MERSSEDARRQLTGLVGEEYEAHWRAWRAAAEDFQAAVTTYAARDALVAVARSILVSVWHLMNDPTARYRDFGADFHTRNLDPHRKSRDLVRQLKTLGHNVTLTPAAA